MKRFQQREKDLNIHDELNHADEHAPTTSKFGSCDYESDSELDLDKHLKTHKKKDASFAVMKQSVCLS